VTQLTLCLLLATGVVTMLDWRQGLLMCVLVGIAQDPLRKLAPNQPVYYVVLVGAIFGLAWVRAALIGVPLGPSVVQGWKKHLKPPFVAFFVLVLAQALHSFVSYGSAMLPLIGLLVWLSPVPAVMLAYQFASRRGIFGVRRWMLWYAIVAMMSLSGVYFEYVGFEWRTLGEIGEGQVLYDLGTVLKSYSGFFRSSEIAAWHTAAIACFIFILSIGKRATVIRVLTALSVIAVLVSLGILTGRRKMLVEITVFLCTYFFLVAWLQQGMARLAMVLVAAGAIGYIGIVGFISPDAARRTYAKQLDTESAKRFEGYAARGQTVFADLPKRVNELGVQPVMWATERFGWLGAGLGTGSQGTSGLAEASNINRGAAEGGLGKITMELGLPGLGVVFWVVVAFGKHLRRQLVVTARLSPEHTRVAYGMLAFLIANAANFSVATQAFSDLFILLILGCCLGFLLAMPVLAAQGDRLNRRRRKRASAFGGDRRLVPGNAASAHLAVGPKQAVR
jgi:hypothetical protein